MKSTFYDQWYRIASLRVGLRPGQVVRLHHYRDEPWYVMHEPAHAGYYRLSPNTYEFVCQISPERTVDQIWRAAVETNPEVAPGQEEVYELLSALHKNNLLFIEGGIDEGKVLERYSRKKHKPLMARLSELLFLRIPLWDPDPWLSRHRPWFSRWLGWPVWLVVGLLATWAAMVFLLDGPRIWDQAESILQLGNLLPLYIAIFMSHFLHEMAHAVACKQFGGQVRTMGVMLLMFTPLPYVDLSSSWTFRDRWQRAWVDAAGMAMDLLVGAVATIVWSLSPPGMINELAYNLMFTTVVYTFLFNINPLMRFDGYYLLSDALNIPNLHEAARQLAYRWWRMRILGLPDDPDAPDWSVRRRAFLLAFFATSNVYRMAVMLGIALFVADQYLGVGLLVGLALLFTSFVKPLKQVGLALRNPAFVIHHQKKLRTLGLGLLLLLAMAAWLPLPDSRVLPGVIEASEDTPLYAESPAMVRDVLVQPGSKVLRGQLLVQLDNPELKNRLDEVTAQLVQVRTQERRALSEGSVDLTAVHKRLQTLLKGQQHLFRQISSLQVRAPHDGLWTSTDLRYLNGSWIARGKELGRVVDERKHVFSGVVRQELALDWQLLSAEKSQVRIEGQRDLSYSVRRLTVVPYSQKDLPSDALTPMAGGDLPVNVDKNTGNTAAEQFFLVQANLAQDMQAGEQDTRLNGRTAWMRVELPAQPILPRLWQSLQQYFQRRYQV